MARQLGISSGDTSSLLWRLSSFDEARRTAPTYVVFANLATHGFYFNHEEKLLNCSYCGVPATSWYDVISKHSVQSPACPGASHVAGGRSQDTSSRSSGIRKARHQIELMSSEPDGNPASIQEIPSLLSSSSTRTQSFHGEVVESGDPEQPCEGGRISSGQNSIISGQSVSFGQDFTDKTSVTDESLQALDYTDNDLKKKVQDLETRNQTMRDGRLCRICMDSEVDIVFLGCGHLVSCSECAAAVRKCPLCREVIKGTVRVLPK